MQVAVFPTQESVIREIARIVSEVGGQAFLFGSAARGSWKNSSDVDVAVKSSNFPAIEEKVDELNTFVPVDLIDLNSPNAILNEGVLDDSIRIA